MKYVIVPLVLIMGLAAILLAIGFNFGYHDAEYAFWDENAAPTWIRHIPTYRLGEREFEHGKGQLYWSNEDQRNETCGLASTEPDKYECADTWPQDGVYAGKAVPIVVNDGDLPDICFDRHERPQRCNYKTGNWGTLLRFRVRNLATGQVFAAGDYYDMSPGEHQMYPWLGNTPHDKMFRHRLPFSHLPYPANLYTLPPTRDVSSK